MENISTSILSIFGKIDGDTILQYAQYLPASPQLKESEMQLPVHLDSDIPESILVNRILKVDRTHTVDQILMLAQVVIQQWLVPDNKCQTYQFCKNQSIFNVLLYFSIRCLRIVDGDPVCRYNQLLRWHTLTTKLGEDLFTTSFIAARGVKLQDKERSIFDWPAYLEHDCKEINAITGKGMADLHMHLKGSSWNFDISWLCIMNHIGVMQKMFDDSLKMQKFEDSDKDLYVKMRRAAAIRLYLAGVIGCIEQKLTFAQLLDIINPNNMEEEKGKTNKKTREQIINIQEILNNCNREKEEYDYISKGKPHSLKDNEEEEIIASERRFMYKVFVYIYKEGGDNDQKKRISTLFYAYLAYKVSFRNYLLQLNDRVGFANFSFYEERKMDFVLPQYEQLVYKAALKGFLEKNKKNYVEARIAPKDSESAIVEQITKIINTPWVEDYKERFHFIFHFIKKRDLQEKGKYRHYALRQEYKKQAMAIYNFRRNQKGLKDQHRSIGTVVGLDAANSELLCRPEVLAQAFRFLREHDCGENEYTERPEDLQITYHVGEDFMDIADGLRAIEEALIFLNLGNGDRLGHALALGLNVRHYYAKRYHTICAPKHVLLDNFVWLYHHCVRLFGYTPLSGYLQMMYSRYFNDIYVIDHTSYGNDISELFLENNNENSDKKSKNDSNYDSNYDINDYYQSWLLRGNSPIFGYELSTINEITDNAEKAWRLAGINHYEESIIACKNLKAKNLCDKYQSYKYSEIGYQAESFSVPKEYRDAYYELLEHIQEDMMGRLERKHIAIECNPSSNFKIGDMDKYDQHPILRFYNDGLATPYKPHHMAVSINTDDQGVFSTSLEREYSLIALAIERNEIPPYVNSPRAIAEWLERVRQMAYEQSFDESQYKSL